MEEDSDSGPDARFMDINDLKRQQVVKQDSENSTKKSLKKQRPGETRKGGVKRQSDPKKRGEENYDDDDFI